METPFALYRAPAGGGRYFRAADARRNGGFPGAPPTPALSAGWLFPAVWTALYTLMGVSSFLVLVSGAPQEQVRTALFFYGAQLLLNFVWPLLFFLAKAYLFAFFWLLALFVLVAVTLVRFGRIQKAAGWLLLPYLVWTAFALYLNLGIYLLN